MATLPSPRRLVVSLFSSISTSTGTSTTAPTGNPLQDTTPETRKALLTLHVLFPNELLPALDLLDRGLVTRSVLARQSPPQHQPEQPARSEGEDGASEAGRSGAVYYVRSAQQPQSRHQHRLAVSQTPSYEVRLTSWSCSCPAFAFAAFPAETGTALSTDLRGQYLAGHEGSDWTFGGLTIGSDMPVCKHLLACVLVERCEIFRSFAVEQEISIEELAGWAAGWGD